LIPISSRSILILSSHLRLGHPKCLFPVGLTVKILKALLFSSILATCPAHLNILDLITLTALGEILQKHRRKYYNKQLEQKISIQKIFLLKFVKEDKIIGCLNLLLWDQNTSLGTEECLGKAMVE
jgi:hypothetical protein